MAPPRARSSPIPTSARGVALVLVLTTIAILTAIGVDFSYQSRISLKLAENLRDETRAEYLAKSAVNLSRLLLHFQKQVDQTGGQLAGALTALAGPQAGGPKGLPPALTTGGAAPAAASNNLGIRLWEAIPINSNAISALLSGHIDGAKGLALEPAGETAPIPAGDRPALHAFGSFDGTFSAKVVDENSRINVVGLDGLGGAPLSALIQLRALTANPRYDFIFDEPDANGERVNRDDVILALKDWIDLDETGSAIDPTNPRAPFVNGFSDENAAYARATPPYKAKNAHFDSLEELYLVHGVSDRYMAAFGDRLTIWPDINSKLNINTDDPQQMLTNVLIAAANPSDPMLRDPRLLQIVLQEIQLRKMFSFFGLSANDFVSILQANNIRLRPEIDPRLNGNAGQFFGSTSDTFRITATGRVGRVEKTVVAVVRYDDLLGRLLYWKEE